MSAAPRDPLELALRSWFAARPTPHAPILADCAGVLHAERQAGNSCADLAAIAARTGHAPDAILAALRSTPLCTDGSAPGAFVLDAQQRLYFHRTWQAEQSIARALARRIAAPTDADPVRAGERIRAQFARAADAVDWQALAVAAAVRNRFTVITGGPGTGKTYTIARLILVLRDLQPGLSFALAAPTGKAARRMQESLAQAGVADLPEPQTLHALLGFRGDRATFARGAHNRIPHDLVLVDEASMADVELLHALLLAMRPEARLVLVGDRDQLPSVDLGQLLADLCGMAQPELGPGRALSQWCRAAGLCAAPRPDPTADDPMADVVVSLRATHRFAADSGLGRAARAIAERRPADVLALLQDGPPDFRRVDAAGLEPELQRLGAAFRACTEAADAAAALAAHQRIRVLCVHNDGPGSVRDLNRRIERLLGIRKDWYPGRPILVTRNDADLGLNNGELGVCWLVDGVERVCFPSDGGPPRTFLLEQLPEHRTAWAMTVHKAQGSEADEVLLVLAARADGPAAALLQAPLVYTGLTRARTRATIVADQGVFAAALATWPRRASGLVDALRSAQAD